MPRPNSTGLPTGLQRHGGGYRYRWTHPMTKTRQVGPTLDLADAKTFRLWVLSKKNEILAVDPRIERGVYLYESIKKVNERVTLREHTLEWLFDRQVTERTRSAYEQALKRLDFVIDQELLSFTPAEVGRVRDALLLKGYQPLTTANTIRILRSIIKHAATKGVIADDPSPAFDYRKTAARQRKHRYLTPEEYSALRACARDDETRLMFDLMFKLGLRIGEMLAIRPKQLHLAEARPYLEVDYCRHQGGGYDLPKFGRKRELPLPQGLAADLRKRLAKVGSRPFIFFSPYNPMQSRSHHGFTKTAWGQAVDRAIADGGLSLENGRPTPHDLRHSYAAIMLTKHPLTLVAKRMGHGSSAVTGAVYEDYIERITDPSTDTIENELAAVADVRQPALSLVH